MDIRFAGERPHDEIFLSRRFLQDRGWLLLLMLLYVLFQLCTIQYGYHRDELYYLILSERLDFGYLDMPALAPFLLFLVRSLLGTSLTVIHLLPALSGAAVILLAFSMARELGGGRKAALLAAAAAAVAPQYLGGDSLYTYDYLDKLFWVLGLFFLIRYFKRGTNRSLYLFGLAVGLGLLSKISIVFLGGALVAGLLLTRRRKMFLRLPLYLAGTVAVLFLAPYLVWQALHGWPTVEFFRHYASGKTFPVSLPGFLFDQVLTMNPVSLFLWLAGLFFLWKKDKGTYRPVVFMFAFLILVFFAIQAKYYMLAPFFPVLFAAGAVLIAGRAEEKRKQPWVSAAYTAVLCVTGLLLSPLARPVLAVDTFIRVLGGSPEIKQERHELRDLPQHFADRFGWPELAEQARAAYESLTPEEKAKAVFLTANYGEASAINFFGRKYGLAEAVSGHNQYFLWGPRGHTGEVLISFRAGTRDELLGQYESVEEAGRTDMKYAIPYEDNSPFFVCRKPRSFGVSLIQYWPKLKSFN